VVSFLGDLSFVVLKGTTLVVPKSSKSRWILKGQGFGRAAEAARRRFVTGHDFSRAET
jgi:hypothetical protein